MSKNAVIVTSEGVVTLKTSSNMLGQDLFDALTTQLKMQAAPLFGLQYLDKKRLPSLFKNGQKDKCPRYKERGRV